MRKAASVLADAPAISAAERRDVQALIEGWLATRGERAATGGATAGADAASPSQGLSPADLRSELDRFKAELRAGGLKESTVHAYLLGSSLFVRWLAGDYVPGPGYSGRARAFTAEERS